MRESLAQTRRAVAATLHALHDLQETGKAAELVLGHGLCHRGTREGRRLPRWCGSVLDQKERPE